MSAVPCADRETAVNMCKFLTFQSRSLFVGQDSRSNNFDILSEAQRYSDFSKCMKNVKMYISTDSFMEHFPVPTSPEGMNNEDEFDLPPPPSLSAIISRDMSIAEAGKLVDHSVSPVPNNPDASPEARVADEWTLPTAPLFAASLSPIPQELPLEDEWGLPSAPVVSGKVPDPSIPAPLPLNLPVPQASVGPPNNDPSEWDLPFPPGISNNNSSRAAAHVSNLQWTPPVSPVDPPLNTAAIRQPPASSPSDAFNFDLPIPPDIFATFQPALPDLPIGSAGPFPDTQSDATFRTSHGQEVDDSILHIPSHPSDSLNDAVLSPALGIAVIQRQSPHLPSPSRGDHPFPATATIPVDSPMGPFELCCCYLSTDLKLPSLQVMMKCGTIFHPLLDPVPLLDTMRTSRLRLNIGERH